MKLLWVIFVCLLFFILLIISNLVLGFGNNRDEISFDRTFTKAFCSGQTCRDFLVSCSGSEVVGLELISSFVTFGEDWVDLREDNELC